MDELRGFLAQRGKELGNRDSFLDIEFQQATDRLTLGSYKAFGKLCRAGEWDSYESEMVAALPNAAQSEQLKIHMHRSEYRQGVDLLSTTRYPDTRYGGDDILKVVVQLETEYPDKVLNFYRSGLGNLNQNATRETFARWAKT